MSNERDTASKPMPLLPGAVRAIECSFPLAEISLLAERESWRKEIFRPIYHIHKWWANRIGSVFRAIILGVIADQSQDIWHGFYKKHRFQDKIILDPFMGSGTTLGETAKLGARPIGCDINPISTFAVTQAPRRVDTKELERTFLEIANDVMGEISAYYTTIDPTTGSTIPVLYYFWVKVVDAPSGETIPLFSSYVFSKNVYPQKKPEARIICPECWQINTSRYDTKKLTCRHCGHSFDPQRGPASGRYVTDSQGNKLEIKELLPQDGSPPRHRLYAMLALQANDEKVYLVPQRHDLALLEQVKERLRCEALPLPTMVVRPGHNTNQARNYNYLFWRDFFNERQLLCLGILLRRIMQVQNHTIRDQLLCLFSSTLEFNNMFCSFKGEGTGAVRHMFSHHILKPERTPLENNVWGTPKSSGSFSTLFRSRLLKAKQYLGSPFELQLEQDLFGNIRGSFHITASEPLNLQVVSTWNEFKDNPDRALVLNGDSAALPIPDGVVDAVVTDPPYFDFVHYSELSDFFFAWLAPVAVESYPFFNRTSSHDEGEVQNKHPDKFATNLSRVFRECHRVLKDDGILTFSFRHSRPDGWAAIYKALLDADFDVVAIYPILAEMRVASPKSGAKEPISLDIIMVCRKHSSSRTIRQNDEALVEEIMAGIIGQFERVGVELSKADLFNIHAGLLLIRASCARLPHPKLKNLLVNSKAHLSTKERSER